MTASSSDSILPGVLVLIVLLPIFYFIGRAGTILGDFKIAHLLTPIAPVINGHVERSRRRIVGTYDGRALYVFADPKRSVGLAGGVTSRINEFSIAIPDLPGVGDWRLQFYLTGTFGQGPRELAVQGADEPLQQRLEQSGVIEDVGAVTSATQSYVTVQYEKRTQTLTLTDDVAPLTVPSSARFSALLALASRLAVVNARVNST